MTATLYCGDARDVLATLPERSVQTCVTSPPYWGLRDYGTASWEGGDISCAHQQGRPGAGRADGVVDERAQRNRDGAGAMGGDCRRCGACRVDAQLGLERTPSEYVASMVEVFRGVWRVLRDDGTLWLNLGDSYAREPAKGGTGTPNGRNVPAMGYTGAKPVPVGLKQKDLVGIPWRVAFALQADGWYLRSDIIWAKPNPMPESVTDRPTKSHEFVFLLTKSERYYYDAAAIAEPAEFREYPTWEERKAAGDGSGNRELGRWDERVHRNAAGVGGNGTTRNARTVWTIATQPYAGAHFATFPEELARRCILAGSSAKACETCGAPWERVVERVAIHDGRPRSADRIRPEHGWGGLNETGSHTRMGTQAETLSWQPTCACEANTGAASSVVLDPFGGSGTTAAVAVGHGRRALHIDLNPAYIEMARQRIGPMLCEDGAMTPEARPA